MQAICQIYVPPIHLASVINRIRSSILLCKKSLFTWGTIPVDWLLRIHIFIGVTSLTAGQLIFLVTVYFPNKAAIVRTWLIFNYFSGKAGLESQNVSALKEMPTKQSEENDEELLRTFIKYSPQRSAACSYPAEVEHTPVSTDVSGSEMDTSWTGLLQNHGSSPEKDFDALKTSSDCAPLSSMSEDPQVTVQTSSALGVTVKQEVILQSDQCEGSESMEKEARSKFVSRPAKQHRQSSGSCKQNHISHKAAVQEVMKVHPKSAVGLKLQAALQQLQRPIKKTAQSFSSSTTAVLSLGHSPSANLNSVSRIPSTSKTNSPPPPSVPRPRLSDRQAAALGRNTASWIGIRSQHQSAGSNNSNPALHSSSHAGPRHLLRCGQCGKCFPHPSNLKAHLQTHTGERPFCCSLCGRSFTKLSNLKAHRRVHTGERPYCCSACGKRFTQKCNLKRHQRIHLDVWCETETLTVRQTVCLFNSYQTCDHVFQSDCAKFFPTFLQSVVV